MKNSLSSPNSGNTILWDRLAKLLYTKEGCETVMLMRQSGLLNSEISKNITEQLTHTKIQSTGPRAIGPWAPRKNGKHWEFVRESKWDKYLWLEERDILTSDKKEGTYRVCLVGESVAAGMFFSPNISPAKVLKSILGQTKPANTKQVEVIDLSRNAMRIEMLVDIVDAASQLNPDVIVIFAGNNFCRDHTIGRPDQKNISNQHILLANQEGATGLINHFTEELIQATQAAINTLIKNAKHNASEIIWLIPTTCKNWQRLSPVHWLGGGKTKQWHDYFKNSLNALKLNDYQKVLEFSQAMEKLDKRTCPTTQRLLAIALNGLEQLEEAARHCQYEVDVDCALERNSFLSPGIQSSIETLILESSKHHGFKCINLKSVFSQYINSLTISEELFVDYCHLNDKGMRVAMSAVAEKIFDTNDWKKILQETEPFAVDPKFIARGLFESTIYTSHMQHNLQMENNASYLRQRFYRALNHWEGLAQTMTEYIHMRHGSIVTEVSQHAHQIVASANSLLDYGILQWIHGIDSQTIEAICGAMDDAGYDGNKLLTYYQEYDRGKLKDGIDLTNPRYIKYFGRDGNVDWDPERGTYRTQPYLRAYWPQLPLVFVANKGYHLGCRLTCRLPRVGDKERQGIVKININGIFIEKFVVTDTWSRQHFSIAEELVKEGFNDIELEWPELPEDDDSAIDDAIQKLQTLGCANWHPVFGEVFSFRIKPYYP